jgi:biopolymer transport protein ExbB/TolQ
MTGMANLSLPDSRVRFVPRRAAEQDRYRQAPRQPLENCAGSAKVNDWRGWDRIWPLSFINFAGYADFEEDGTAGPTTMLAFARVADWETNLASAAKLVERNLAVSRINKLLEWVLSLPILWGGVAGLAFYASLHQGWINSPLLVRYMAGHPVEYCTGITFFVALAALAMRFLDQTSQFSSIGGVTLPPAPARGTPIADCDTLVADLDDLPAALQKNYLAHRMREALEMVRRRDSADAIEEHLHHLAELDRNRVGSSYALVRIIVWAMPVLGFLGTVIGITVAIASLSPETMEKSMPAVIHGLGIAFDTTAQALALTMVVMFIKHGVERADGRLLDLVDARAAEELVGRFQFSGTDGDPNVASIRRMSEQVIGAVESLVSRQAELWRSSIDATHQQWADVSTSTGKIIQNSLTGALRQGLEEHARRLNEGTLQYADKLSSSSGETVAHLREGLEKLAELLVESLHRHGEVLTASESELAQENRRHLSEVEAALGESMVVAADRQERLIRESENLLKEMQIALVEAAEATVRQQEQLIRQGDVLLQVVDATSPVRELEEALNKNLAALVNAQHFDEMALNLTAAIQLLCARVGYAPSRVTPEAALGSQQPTSHAA